MKNNNYYSLVVDEDTKTASLNIYGEICHYAWEEFGEMSAVNLSNKLEQLTDVDVINVFINSYGGEVAEGLAIYNALKRHKAKIVTCVDGFACSIASVIFMAGDERIMNQSSLLMIHNAWTRGTGNAKELRKLADDVEKITQASVEAYKANSSIDEATIKELMDKETWISPNEAIEYGFATAIATTETNNPSQSTFHYVYNLIMKAKQDDKKNDEGVGNDDGTDNKKAPDKDGQKENPDDPDNTNNDEGEGKDDDPDAGNNENGESDDDEAENKQKEATKQLLGSFFDALIQ